MFQAATKKAKGDISSVFAQLGGSKPVLEPRFVELKKQIAGDKRAALQQSFERLQVAFEKENAEIKERGSAVIPEVTLAAIEANGGLVPDAIAAEVRKRGVLVIRNVVPKEVAEGYKRDIQQYINKHRAHMVGFPEDNPAVWEVYWSKAQIAARGHPRFATAATAVSRLWHTADDATPVDLTKNLAYCDRLRIRPPGDSKFALGGHIDGGSVERWEDPEYRRCYTKIFDGQWEDYDAFDVTHRLEAEMQLYDSPGGCSMFRIFQGWLAMSSIEQGGGTLRVSPLIKEPTAYYLLKPLLEENINEPEFLGAWPGRAHDITDENHKPILDSMVSVPAVEPGDAVFWHCDTVHAVEPKNNMDHDSSVLYIPSTPMCRRNSLFLKQQRDHFERGLTPPDFPDNNCEETLADRATPETMDTPQRQSMGFARFDDDDAALTDGQKKAQQQHNEILGL
ncbi:DUF1479-domain-containing protein [Gongronella butleri]|nr:DUF1479-domain-containing protein [Gongronella butleri]